MYLVKELLHYCNISVSTCSEIQPARIDFYGFTFVTEGSMTYVLDGKQYVKLTVIASTDVDKLTINGTPLWADNLMWVNMGKADAYVYTQLVEITAGQSVRFDVVAYNKAGQASKIYTQFR